MILNQRQSQYCQNDQLFHMWLNAFVYILTNQHTFVATLCPKAQLPRANFFATRRLILNVAHTGLRRICSFNSLNHMTKFCLASAHTQHIQVEMNRLNMKIFKYPITQPEWWMCDVWAQVVNTSVLGYIPTHGHHTWCCTQCYTWLY